MEVAVYKTTGELTGKKVQLDDAIFAIEPNDHAIYLDVKQFLANQRQGTHKTKEKSEMSGSTRKLIKQKGSGGARRGSIKSPVLVGGARVFGPRPRDYDFKLNKKVKQIARRSALTYKVKENAITILENINFEAPKTKLYLNLLNNFKISDKKTLIVLSESNKSVYLSSRNLKQTKVVLASNLNTYDILKAKHMLISEDSIEKINAILSE
ncbi:MAG: 50S ribosomal protein L4 [Bacteroidota bacterium]